MKTNIRCCCDCRIIGRVELPREPVRGETWVLGDLEFEVDSVHNSFYAMPRELALKSRDYPIEKIRAIPGFEEKEYGSEEE